MIKLPSINTLKHRFWYHPESGVFRWRNPTSNRVKPWSISGNTESRGYLQVQINKKFYMAHRLAWLYMTGQDPGVFQIDHINKNKQDNSWGNLRLATNKQNCENRSVSSANKTGFRGVYQKGNRFVAEVCHNYKRIKLGTFATAQEAAEVAERKRRELFTHD